MSYNKNVKLYIQNINKTSRKEYYHISSDLFLKDVYDINRKLAQENVPLDDVIDQIEYLKKKYNVFTNKDKSNTYLTLLNLLNTATYKNDAITYQNLYIDASNNLVETQQLLEYTQNQLEECRKYSGAGLKGFRLPPVDVKINTNIKQEYIIYIREYGFPSDGIFIEALLTYIRDVYII